MIPKNHAQLLNLCRPPVEKERELELDFDTEGNLSYQISEREETVYPKEDPDTPNNGRRGASEYGTNNYNNYTNYKNNSEQASTTGTQKGVVSKDMKQQAEERFRRIQQEEIMDNPRRGTQSMSYINNINTLNTINNMNNVPGFKTENTEGEATNYMMETKSEVYQEDLGSLRNPYRTTQESSIQEASMRFSTDNESSPPTENCRLSEYVDPETQKVMVTRHTKTSPFFGIPIPNKVTERKLLAIIGVKYFGATRKDVTRNLGLTRHIFEENWESWYQKLLDLGKWVDSGGMFIGPSGNYNINRDSISYSGCGGGGINGINPANKKLPRLRQEVCDVIIKFVDESNLKSRMPLMRDIINHVKESGFYADKKIMSKYLRALGYSFRKVPTITPLRFKPHVQENKKKYLEDLFLNRLIKNEEIKLDEVYTDETFVSDDHCRATCWVRKGAPLPIVKPITHGDRILIVAAMSREGWVGADYNTIENDLVETGRLNKGLYKHGSILYFKANNPDLGDYHQNFNIQNFKEYYEGQLIPSMTRPSLIIMDRATYHSHIEDDEINPRKAKKEELYEWLLAEGAVVPPNSSMMDLRRLTGEMLKNLGRSILYVDKVAEASGHRVLFLPQYHPEFNPIEHAWGVVKKPLANDPVFNMHRIMDVELPKTFAKMDAPMSDRLYNHISKEIERQIHFAEGSMGDLPSLKRPDPGMLEPWQVDTVPTVRRKRFVKYKS